MRKEHAWTDEIEQPDRPSANLRALTPEHIEVLGDELLPIYSAFVADHECGLLIEPEHLHELLRLLRGRCRDTDELWIQAALLKLIQSVVSYLAKSERYRPTRRTA